MTKKKKDKKDGAVGKLASKTIGLVLRVGDALEAVAAAAEPAAPTPPAAAPPAANPAAMAAPPAPAAPVPPTVPPPAPPPPLAPAPGLAQTVDPIAPAPVANVATIEAVDPAQIACVPMVDPVPVASAPVPAVVGSPTFDDGVRAALAIETYCAVHNLRIVDMPPYATLIDALKGSMAKHGSHFTDAEARAILDEQMRGHFRVLGAARRD